MQHTPIVQMHLGGEPEGVHQVLLPDPTGEIGTMLFRTLFIIATGALLLLATANAQDAEHGKRDYKLCAACHGFSGEGNQLVNAPAIAGLEPWYIERQLVNFRDGIRGHAEDDHAGKTMAQMTKGLVDDRDIADLVAYISSLPTYEPGETLDGDTTKGQAAYGTCASCHGADGGGNEALNAPGLTGIDDWYQLAQLIKFKSGLRGVANNDTYGRQMAPMAAVLADEEAMKDVIAYIRTLRD